MARGIYSALGRWPEAQLPEALATLRRICDAIARDAPELELAELGASIVAAARAIRMFEARVGLSCGLVAELVTTPRGRAIELGNRDHVAFPAHADAAEVVARTLVPVLEAVGATGAFWFTVD